jgi:4-hydroxyacetophenone monooxygenase
LVREPVSGLGVDSPNHFYSYSFEPSHEWTEFYSKRDELHQYFENCVDKYDLHRDIRFETEVVSLRYNEASASWDGSIRGKDGAEETLRANAVITAVGKLNRPKLPDIPELDTFEGAAFYTAGWDESVDLAGKRVAMIGTGASGMQTGLAIAGEVDWLTIFQRSSHWVIANPNYHRFVTPGKKWILERLPHYARWYRFQLFWGFSTVSTGQYRSIQISRILSMPSTRPTTGSAPIWSAIWSGSWTAIQN